MKLVLFAFVGIISLSIMACSQGAAEKTPAGTTAAKLRAPDKDAWKKKPFHGDIQTVDQAVVNRVIAEAMKMRKLSVDSTKTIGEAFDSYKYGTKKEWRETHTRSGPYFIDYICRFDISPVSSVALKDGVVQRRLEVKFAVHEDGETYITMVSRIDIKTDGMEHVTRYNPLEMEKIVTAIYENREIVF